MKKGFRSDTNSVFIIICDNLGEYFAEFAKYRNSFSESEWANAKIMYSQGTVAFKDEYKENQIVDFLVKDYDNVFEGRNGRIELTLPVDLKSSEWLSQKEKINQTLKDIWKTGEVTNTYGLDLNWPVASQPGQNRLPDNTDKNQIKNLEKEISELKEQAKKENNNKTIWMVISIAVFSVFALTLFFSWSKIKKLKKR